MQSAWFNGRVFEVRELPRPQPSPDEVLVDVHACGICGSDLHFYRGGVPAPNVCPGHEISGWVAEGAPGWPAGVPVVLEPIRSCGACAWCREGQPNLCSRLQVLGRQVPGGFADTVVVPAAAVHRVPEGLDLDTAMLAEPMAVAVHAVDLAHLVRGNEVLVLGGGTIGLLTAFVAGRAGCRVTLSARHFHQSEAAQRLGVSRVIPAAREAVLDEVRGRQPDVVFESVGGEAETPALAVEAVRPAGAIVVMGVFTRSITLPSALLLAKEARVVPAMMYRRQGQSDFARALALLREDHATLGTLITHRVPLEAIERGFAIAGNRDAGAIKVAVDVAQKL